MGRAKYKTAPDGLSARVAPSWTEEKLMILEAYLDAFAHACRKAGGWYAMDLFAGPGFNWSEMRDEARNGSPVIALEAGNGSATQVIAAESHAGSLAALQERTARFGERVRLFNGDANQLVPEMLRAIPVRAPTFCFLDPEGSELDWTTVTAIADHKRDASPHKIEQLILFPTDTGFMRLAPDYPNFVTRIFGHDRWREIHQRRLSGELSPDEARDAYVRLYGQGLKDLGYQVVLDRQITKSTGQPMYFLIFATDHQAGERIMDHCFDQMRIRVKEELGQGQLFQLKEAPRRKRLGEG
ncbi:MAG: three-Cys-motif partner protein TcmP [Thermomicrobiales bacterium]